MRVIAASAIDWNRARELLGAVAVPVEAPTDVVQLFEEAASGVETLEQWPIGESEHGAAVASVAEKLGDSQGRIGFFRNPVSLSTKSVAKLVQGCRRS